MLKGKLPGKWTVMSGKGRIPPSPADEWQTIDKRQAQSDRHSHLELTMDLRQFSDGQTQHPSPGFPWALSYATAQSLFLSRMKLFPHPCSTDWSGPWRTSGSPVQISQISSSTERFVYGLWWQANRSVPSFSLTGWVERFCCQTSVRPHFSSLLRRVPLAAANIWLWLICQGWLYNGNGEMDCQLQLVFSDCLADEGLAAGLTALEHSRCRLGGKEPIFKWVLKMRKGSRWLIFLIYLLTPGLAFLASTIGRKATLRFAFYSVDLKCFILLISVLTAQMKGVKESIPYFTLKMPQGKQYLWCPLKCFQHANNGGHMAGMPSLFPLLDSKGNM